MRKAIRILAASLGIFAGIGGPEHGYFEILQGHVRPDSLVIAAMGPPCEPEQVWNMCEPAMTVLPSFLVTGILATIIGIMTMIWAAAFIHKKGGALGLALLSIALLLFGGGLVPPVIGIVGAVIATRINTPQNKKVDLRSGCVSRVFALTWPWPLVAFFTLLFGQFIVGHYFNEWMIESGFLVPFSILGLMVLSIVSGFAYDARRQID
jgi:hypothetical protein